MKVDYKVYKYSEDGFVETLNTDSFQQSIDCWSTSRNSSWGPYIVAECDAKTQVLNSTESIREWSRWLMLHGYNRIERRIMKDMKEMKAMEVVEPEDKEMSFTEEMPELMGKVFGGLAPEEVDRLSKLNLNSIPKTKTKVSEGSAFKAAWDELDHQEQDSLEDVEVTRDNNTNTTEYRVFNVSMREMQIQTSDFEQAYQVWSDGVAATADCWTLLVMPANNGKKQYLQAEGSVNDYRMSLTPKAAWDELDHQEQDAIINPAHYKMIPAEAYEKYPEGLEYMDLMEYILSHHKGIESHLLGQVFKYACRLGRKDAMGQDAKKIQWYATRLAAVING
jgi:hypothetical protein